MKDEKSHEENKNKIELTVWHGGPVTYSAMETQLNFAVGDEWDLDAGQNKLAQDQKLVFWEVAWYEQKETLSVMAPHNYSYFWVRYLSSEPPPEKILFKLTYSDEDIIM